MSQITKRRTGEKKVEDRWTWKMRRTLRGRREKEEDQLGRTRTRNSQAVRGRWFRPEVTISETQYETGTTKRRSLQPECVTARK